jgi:glycosyltransferase involved in cell wall biosynthesis
VKILFLQKMAAISGSELYLMHMLPELKKRGYEVEVLVIFPEVPDGTRPFIEHFQKNGIKTHEIYGHRALSPKLIWKLRNLLKKGSYDIVQPNLIHSDLWMAIVKCLFRRKQKLISVKHGFDEAYSAQYGNDPKYLKRTLFYWLQKISGWYINYNVTISKGLYNMYVDGRIVPKNKIKNIYYGLDLKDKELLVEEHTPAEPFALILGRLVKYKGHELLIRAWKKVININSSWKLYITGGGKYEQELVHLVKKMQLEQSIVFTGYQANPHQLIKDSRFMLVTSIWEGFGLIMLESWVHKKPIIAFNTPAMNEVIDDNKNGLVADAFDIDQLANKIIYYFTHPEQVEQHGQQGYHKLYQYFNVNRMADEMCEVYSEIYNSK